MLALYNYIYFLLFPVSLLLILVIKTVKPADCLNIDEVTLQLYVVTDQECIYYIDTMCNIQAVVEGETKVEDVK